MMIMMKAAMVVAVTMATTMVITIITNVYKLCQMDYSKCSFIRQLSISKVALAAYFYTAHYNSPRTLAANFCHYPASRGISRAVPKVSQSSTGSAVCIDQLTRQPRLVFIIAHIKIAYCRSPFSLMAKSIYRHTPFPKHAG
jgi:hypothetical protein